MEKLSLDNAWKWCMAQWDHIKAEIEAGRGKSVVTLKREWIRDNGFEGVRSHCFFCEYDKQHGRCNCSSCPGKIVDSFFLCDTGEYGYEDHPLKFHAELMRLNKIRLEKPE